MDIHDRAPFDGISSQVRFGAMEKPESAGPPPALGVDVGAGVEQDIQHLAAAHPGDQRRIEGGHRVVDLRFQLGMAIEHASEQDGVVFGERFLEDYDGIAGFE